MIARSAGVQDGAVAGLDFASCSYRTEARRTKDVGNGHIVEPVGKVESGFCSGSLKLGENRRIFVLDELRRGKFEMTGSPDTGRSFLPHDAFAYECCPVVTVPYSSHLRLVRK